MRRLGGVLLRTLIMFVLIEGTLWTLAFVGVISLPSVIPLVNFDQVVSNATAGNIPRLYEVDRWALNRLRANAEITYPRLPIFLHGPETYTVRTNSAGMRDPEIPQDKPSGVLRIACLGDSSTFGYNVEVDDAYPRRLQALLDADHPGKFQVLNFGVPGYASLQGVQRLKHLALSFQPDVVTFAFGTNDRFWHGPIPLRDKLHAGQTWRGTILFETREVLNLSATYRALRMLLFRAGALNPQARPMEEQKPGTNEPVVELGELAGAIVETRSLGDRNGFALIVLNLDLNETDAVQALKEGAKRVGAPFVDGTAMLTRQRADHDRELASHHGLAPTTVPDDTHQFVFRVIVDDTPKAVWVRHRPFMVSQMTLDALYDDGTHGDEHAGDGVWSLESNYKPGTKVIYSYLSDPGDGKFIREFRESFLLNGFPMMGTGDRGLLLAGGGAFIDVYGTMYLRADHAHPNEEGHRLIAAQVRDAILALPTVQQALAKP